MDNKNIKLEDDSIEKDFAYELLKIFGESIKGNKYDKLIELIKISENFRDTMLFEVLDYCFNDENKLLESTLEIVDELYFKKDSSKVKITFDEICEKYGLKEY